MARRRVVAELVVVAIGLGLLAAARAVTFEWLRRRFGLDYEHGHIVTIERAILLLTAGGLIFVARPIVGRWTERIEAKEAISACVRFGVALVLSVVASEVGPADPQAPHRSEMGVTFGFQGIPGDNHPDAASTRRLADAVIVSLQTELARRLGVAGAARRRQARLTSSRPA